MLSTFALQAPSQRELFKFGLRDVGGVIASALCVMHCVLTPLAAASLPVLAATEEQTHRGFALVILVLGVLAFAPGFRKHQRTQVLVLGSGGVLLLGAAVFVPEGALPEMTAGLTLETLLTVAGGVILITAHVRNFVFCRLCPVCRDDGHDHRKRPGKPRNATPRREIRS